jgi:hypothetical protein
MMRWHFRDVHPMDLVKVPKEGKFDRCEQCGMQVHPLYPPHRRSKECQVGVEHCLQQEAVVTSALVLCQQFRVRGDVLVQVEVYKYLRQMMAQDDNDLQAIRVQLWKPVLHGLVVDKFFGAKMHCLLSPRNSTRLSSKPFFFMEARLGSSLGLLWRGSRDFT